MLRLKSEESKHIFVEDSSEISVEAALRRGKLFFEVGRGRLRPTWNNFLENVLSKLILVEASRDFRKAIDLFRIQALL